MYKLEQYRSDFMVHLGAKIKIKEPVNLYEPFTYILNLGGKRLRPILTLMTADLFGAAPKNALDAALAIEVFHNFSLVHDDIMDEAPLRRGKMTLHKKWNLNTGILSGDAMLIYSYQLLESYPAPIFKELMQLFTKTALEVCEGQQYDMDFEKREDVSIPEYLLMVRNKTAVLVASAMKMGAIIANRPDEEQNLIYDFGKDLGIAFQLQDDYLDAFGDPKSFGKQLGGDIIENKKTYLYLKAMEMGTLAQAQALEHLYSIKPMDPKEKISSVKELFEETGAVARTIEEIKWYTDNAFKTLEMLQLEPAKKAVLRQFGTALMNREV
ncbi:MULTISPECIES: polyprenyl synthetase family protein [unclassified Arenibacter]|uniref:polyprenyl synthetase family protein n=1 Tax=unclassified Arenibacter TaxID=2615047 RepID=UPI000E3459E1|nr:MULTISPECIES: polyprenyl synthetase family protein [unclassified Arenibacter]MCM4162130.1 polyprenyl synthetase [Arenibacter sp. A80]RFT57746.1 polyprenyl synthetase family protein [Arenibacter sp. P308M17]